MFNFFNFIKKRSAKKNILPEYTDGGKCLLVLIVGFETRHNIDAINYFFKEKNPVLDNADILFVSTPECEARKCREAIERSIQETLPNLLERNRYQCVVVNVTDRNNIYHELDNYFKNNNYDNIWVGLKNGTKYLAIAVYDYFKEKFGYKKWMNIFYYSTLDDIESGEMVKQVLPVFPPNLFDITNRVSSAGTIDSFFAGYGIKDYQKNSNYFLKEEDLIRRAAIICELKNSAGRTASSKLLDLINKKNGFKFYSLSNISINLTEKNFTIKRSKNNVNTYSYKSDLTDEENKRIVEYLSKLGICEIVKYDKLFFACNGWFEALVFYIVKKKNNLNEKTCAMNISFKNLASNELDVAYIQPEKNILNIIECKNSASPNILTEAEYKQKSIASNFGFDTNFELWTTARNDKINQAVKNRAKQFNIKIVSGDEISSMVKELYNVDIDVSGSSKSLDIKKVLTDIDNNIDKSTVYIFEATEIGGVGNLKGKLIPNGDSDCFKGIVEASVSKALLSGKSININEAIGKKFEVKIGSLNSVGSGWIVSEIIKELI